jgi:hypothetical protein
MIAGSDPETNALLPNVLRFDSPDDAALRYKLGIVWGAKAKPPVHAMIFPAALL